MIRIETGRDANGRLYADLYRAGRLWRRFTSTVFHALSIAADRIGASQYAAQSTRHARAGRSLRTFRYRPTDAHLAVVDAMTAVLNGRLSAADAMAILWQHDVFAERLAR